MSILLEVKPRLIELPAEHSNMSDPLLLKEEKQKKKYWENHFGKLLLLGWVGFMGVLYFMTSLGKLYLITEGYYFYHP